jgi:hypothetical protein
MNFYSSIIEIIRPYRFMATELFLGRMLRKLRVPLSEFTPAHLPGLIQLIEEEAARETLFERDNTFRLIADLKKYLATLEKTL